LNDGSVLAQIGAPDMRTPIQYALTYPERPNTGLNRISLLELGQLTFEPPDEIRFPSLRLARHAGMEGGTLPAALNAANEVAVSLFLNRQIPLSGITRLVEHVIEIHENTVTPTLDDIIAADREARIQVERYKDTLVLS